ncbi:SHD1 domain-containing protein [Bremerella volcania]|nr:SHD1 domain-containing protein [Bremerella volcania]
MRTWTSVSFFFGAFLVLFTVHGRLATAAPPQESPKALRCALIDVDQSALAGLVEAELITRPGEEWLERTEINRLLAEKELQSLLSPKAGDGRVALGQTLKADVLILLRTTQKDQQTVAELVVAETNQGLRLLTRQFVVGANLEEHSAALVELIDQAIAKARQEVRQVFAVPPFVSDDLTYEYETLKSSYAKLLEQSLLDSPGVLIVELEEAQAIAKELSLTSESGSIKRRLPIYLLGQFRNEGKEDQRKVQIAVSVQQGSKELDKLQAELSPTAVAEFLRESARQVAQTQGIETTVVDPAVEAEQLNKRAQQFKRLGNWGEALGLIEASLMLHPDQAEVISQAIDVTTKLAYTYNNIALEDVEKSKELHRHVLKHLQTLAQRYSAQHCQPHLNLLRFSQQGYLKSYGAGTALSEELIALQDRYCQEKHQLIMQLSEQFAEAGDWSRSAYLLHMTSDVMTPADYYAVVTSKILEYQDQTNPESVVRNFVNAQSSVDRLRSLEARKFLKQLAEHPKANEKVRQLAKQFITELGVPVELEKKRTSGDPNNETLLTFKPIELHYQDLRGGTRQLDRIEGCIPLEDGSDIFFGYPGVLLLRPGEDLQQLWKPGANTRIESIAFDGRYIWVAAKVSFKRPLIWVLDPQSGEQTELTAEDGLPLLGSDEIPGVNYLTPTVKLAAVGKGRAILAGYVGRTWLADVQFDPAGKHKVNVFHEAKEVVDQAAQDVDWKNANVVFQPVAVRTLSGTTELDKRQQVVMIHRGCSNYVFNTYPLLVDPNDLSVRVSEQKFTNPTSGNHPKNVYQGAHYYVGATPPSFDSIGLVRTGYPALKIETVFSGMREGEMVFNRSGELNVVGTHWQRGRIEDGKLKSYGPVPWLYSNHWGASERTVTPSFVKGSLSMDTLADSNHFGTFIVCQEREGPTGMVQVLFDGSGISLKEALHGPEGNLTVSKSPSTAKPLIAEDRNVWNRPPRCVDLAFSPDGQILVTTSPNAEDAIQVWDAKTGQIMANLSGDTKGADLVVFSHDGKTFATHDSQGRIIIWNAKTFQQVAQCEGEWDKVDQLAYSWSDDRLAAALHKRTIVTWSLPDSTLLFEKPQPKGASMWLGFNADDSLLISNDYVSAAVSNANDGTYIGEVESIMTIGGMLSDRSLVVAGRESDNILMKWDSVDLTSKELWPRMIGIPLAVSPDGRLLAKYIRETFIDGNRKEIYRVEVCDLSTKQVLASVEGLFGKKYVFTPEQDALLIILERGGLRRLEIPPTEDMLTQLGPPPPAMRTWTDSTGKHRREGIFERVLGQQVQLKTSAGQTIYVPLDRLSPEDQKYVREQTER